MTYICSIFNNQLPSESFFIHQFASAEDSSLLSRFVLGIVVALRVWKLFGRKFCQVSTDLCCNDGPSFIGKEGQVVLENTTGESCLYNGLCALCRQMGKLDGS